MVASLASLLPSSSLHAAHDRQNEILEMLLSKHMPEDFTKAEDFHKTSTSRGVGQWEHQHLIAALDTLNAYQQDRRGRAVAAGGPSCGVARAYRGDPRTRFVEVLKRWLRTHASASRVDEVEVRRVVSLCRELLDHQADFPARNRRSFNQTVSEVYYHLQLQLQEVLERDSTCTDLAQSIITMSRNFLSDVITFLMLGATELKATDALPSLEVVALWQVLPAGMPTPAKPDVYLQARMLPAWQTHAGTLLAAVISGPAAVSLFQGRGAAPPAAADAVCLPSVPELLDRATIDFSKGHFRMSGLAGILRSPARGAGRKSFLEAVRCVHDLTYLLGKVFLEFQQIGEGMGDYGIIRTARLLHPFLGAIVDKVRQLSKCIEVLNGEIEEHLVLAGARGQKVEKPIPTTLMSRRAHEAVQRALLGEGSHAASLLASLEALRQRSAEDRLPILAASFGDACRQLRGVVASEEFLACIGDAHRDKFAAATQALPSAPRAHASSLHGGLLVEACDQQDTTHMSRSASVSSMTPMSINEQNVEEVNLSRCASVDSLMPMSINEQNVEEVNMSRCASIDSLMPMSINEQNVEEVNLSRCASIDSLMPMSINEQNAEEVNLSRCASVDSLVPNCADDSDAEGVSDLRHESADSLAPTCTGDPDEGEDIARRLHGPRFAASAVEGRRGTGVQCCRAASQPEDECPMSLELSSNCSTPTFAFGQPEVGDDSWSTPTSTDASTTCPSVSTRGDDEPCSQQQVPPLQVQAWRLTAACQGFARHDSRCLVLSGGRLHIFQKGSATSVKTVVRVSTDIDESQLSCGNVLSIYMRRKVRGLLGRRSEREERKVYFFELPTEKIAAEFHHELLRLQRAAARGTA